MDLKKGLRALLTAAGPKGWAAGPKGWAAGRAVAGLCLAVLVTAPAEGAVFVSSDSLTITIRPRDIWPPAPVSDLTGLAGAEGQILLQWTAPDSNNNVLATLTPARGYEIRIASFSVDSVGGSTTTWWGLATDVRSLPAPAVGGNPPTPGPPGSVDSMLLSTLEPGVTMYALIISSDALGQYSDADLPARTPGGQARALVYDAVPPAPASISAVSVSSSSILVSWSAVAAYDLDFYRVHVDSTSPYDFADQFIITVDSTSASLTHGGLTQATSYSYFVTAVDKGSPTFAGIALESGPSAIVSAVVLSAAMPPMEPMGVSVAAAGATVALGWSPTVSFEDGTLFLSTTTPTTGELIGYTVFRSTEACVLNFVHVASLPYVTTTLVDATGGLNYYYRIFSYNTLGVSSNTLTVSSLGERGFFAGCNNALTMDAAGAAALNAATNGRGADIRIVSRRRPEDLGGAIFQSVEWRALLNGVTELVGFTLPKPARIAMGFNTQGKDLGMYWYNGGEFKKMYGKVDTAAQTVTVDSPNLGVYQIRALFRAAGAVFDLSNISNRVITPNGDGLNDRVIFTYDPGPNNAAVLGRIYDVMGGFIADMRAGLVPNTLAWDGRSNGRAVSGGVYVYKIEGGGKIYTGTVVVAR